MYLCRKAIHFKRFRARHLVDAVAMWFKCNRTPPFRVDCLNAKSSEERVVLQKAELNGNVDSENNHGGCATQQFCPDPIF